MKQKAILTGSVILIIIVTVLFLLLKSQSLKQDSNSSNILWEFNGETWTANGTPPNCPSPLQFEPPTDFNLVTAVLYPGQTRSTGYKSHGGFAFQNNKNEDITVKAPIDAYLVKASRYTEQGELQHFLVFINPCGIMYKIDHLVKLSPTFQEIMEKLPEAKVDDSRTTPIEPPLFVKTGEIIATSVGFTGVQGNRNVAFDFGVIDLRKTNEIANNSEWLAKRRSEGDLEYAPYGLCTFDLFNATDSQRLKNLPAYDSTAGSQSDYCN